MSDAVDITPVEALYKALKVFTEDPRINKWLVEHDPQALTQARNALWGYAVEAEGKEYVVDVFVPISIAVRADDEDMAASMALESLENEGVRARIQEMVDSDDSSFTISDSPAQTEVGEA